MINMSNVAVEPSTGGQYWGKIQTLFHYLVILGKSQIVTFYPTIGFQYTTFHKGIDPKVRVIQCNMVNEDNL